MQYPIERSETHYIVIHGSWSSKEADVGAEEIREWHLARNFNDVGYHYIIRRDGTLEHGRNGEYIGAHVSGNNARSVGICLIGGRPLGAPSDSEEWAFNYTRKQLDSLERLLDDLEKQYPAAAILGHRDFPGVTKDCPGFDVRSWWYNE